MGAGRDVRPPTWKHIVLLAEMKYFESPDVYKHRGSKYVSCAEGAAGGCICIDERLFIP